MLRTAYIRPSDLRGQHPLQVIGWTSDFRTPVCLGQPSAAAPAGVGSRSGERRPARTVPRQRPMGEGRGRAQVLDDGSGPDVHTSGRRGERAREERVVTCRATRSGGHVVAVIFRDDGVLDGSAERAREVVPAVMGEAHQEQEAEVTQRCSEAPASSGCSELRPHEKLSPYRCTAWDGNGNGWARLDSNQ